MFTCTSTISHTCVSMAEEVGGAYFEVSPGDLFVNHITSRNFFLFLFSFLASLYIDNFVFFSFQTKIPSRSSQQPFSSLLLICQRKARFICNLAKKLMRLFATSTFFRLNRFSHIILPLQSLQTVPLRIRDQGVERAWHR